MLLIQENTPEDTPMRRGKRTRKAAWSWLIAAMVLGLGAGACDSLLEVSLPGEIVATDLNDPLLAETLVLSVQADFECGLVDEIISAGMWFDEFMEAGGRTGSTILGLRGPQALQFAEPCAHDGGPVLNFYTPMQLPRIQGRNAREIIAGFDPGDIDDLDFLLARTHFYEGYAIQILGEIHCTVPFDGGPPNSREATWAVAEDRFTTAIDHATLVTGSNAGAAADILAAAYVGRARARLNIGTNPAGVMADASQVPAGFEFYALYEESPRRRENTIFGRNNEPARAGMVPHRLFNDLTIRADGRLTVSDGQLDPRVFVEQFPGMTAEGGDLPQRLQRKYDALSADIPFATGREAQLMMAEVQGGQAAVGIINTLRATVTDLSWVAANTPALPQFSSTDAAEIEATLHEERRRELWMQGTRAGDMIRWGTPFEILDERGITRLPGGCVPVPTLESDANDNY